jgi:hypothetical protein
MKKEVLIAVLIGLSLGLIITYGVYRFRSALDNKPVTNLETTTILTAIDSVPTVLALHSPEHGTVQSSSTLTIAGTTIPNTFVVIFINDRDIVSTSDGSGNFSTKAELDEGSNIIRVHVLEENGESVVEERIVVVSPLLEANDEEANKEEKAVEAQSDQENKNE